MRAPQGEAGPSSAPTNLSLLPANVLTIFVARFHVRQGNQIEFQYPPPPSSASNSDTKNALIDVDDSEDLSIASNAGQAVDLSGVEWKVLPSGGHLIDRDVIYFSTSQKDSTGVACFRNVKLDDSTDGAASQRGARMLSVGLVLKCDGNPSQHSSALAQQLAIIPHLSNLEQLADSLAHADKPDFNQLKDYYTTHRLRPSPSPNSAALMDGKRMKQLRMRRRRDPRNLPHDPISHMPALSGSLGALLPHLLKKLMLPHHRLLIFSPAPPLVHAARLGYNLADLIALAIARSGKRHENLHAFAQRGLVKVRGQIGVHDITTLEDEEKRRRSGKGLEGAQQSWIAWSTDKILLEKPHLFDSVLDLTPLITRDSGGVLDEAALESANTIAKLMKVVRPASSSAQSASGKAELKSETWTTREFATFNELDAQAQRHAERAERLGPSACVSRRRSKNKLVRRRSEDQREAENTYDHEDADGALVAQWRGGCARSSRRSGAVGTLSAILTFLRYWLAGWWFLPSHWRYGLPAAYVLPLGIRGDGGVRASILVMPEDESDESEEDIEDEEDRDIAAEDDEEEERQSSLVVAEPAEMETSAQAIPFEDQNTSTNSSSDTEGLDLHHGHPHHQYHHHLVPPDPLLAAVGASPVRGSGVAADSDRHSMSHASHSLRRRSTDRSLYARSTTGAGGASDILSNDATAIDADGGHDRFHSILSDSLWMVWSHWTTALISGLLDILEDRLAQIESEDADATSIGTGGGEEDVSQLLISRVAAGLELSLGQADMASLA